MAKQYSKIYHLNSKGIDKYISANPLEWPAEWKNTYYKTYPRFPRVELLEPSPVSSDLFNVINSRKSERNFTEDTTTLSEISTLLKYSAGLTTSVEHSHLHFQRRAQPSAGHRYPIELYLLINRPLDKLDGGLYHYNVRDHVLETIDNKSFGEDDRERLFNETWIFGASVVIYMTAVFDRSMQKYGERGYRFVLLEAGHISQNIYTVASALGLKSCAVGGSKNTDTTIEILLDIDGVNESLVHKIVVGH